MWSGYNVAGCSDEVGEFRMSDQQQKTIINMAEEASQTTASELAHQLGSDLAVTEAGLTDMRRLTTIQARALIPLAYCSERGRTTPAFKRLYVNFMNLSVGVNGVGRKDIIRMEAASRSGGSVDVKDQLEKPGWIERHITNRGWEDEQRRRMNV